MNADISQRIDFYIENGMSLTTLAPGAKRPTDNGWNAGQPREELMTRLTSNPELNIGVVLGEISGNLLDSDADCPEAIKLASRFLPKTGWVFGRPGAPRSHRLYRGSESLRRIVYTDPLDGTVLLELRGDKHQTMLPPSRHPSGELVDWDQISQPAEMNTDELIEAHGWLASASFLARHWYDYEGSIHFMVMALAGALIRADTDPDRIEELVRSVCEIVGDNGTEIQCRAVRDTVKKWQDGDNTLTGWPTLIEILTEPVVRQLRRWMQVEPTIATMEKSDTGNSLQLIRHYGKDIRYCPERSRWYIWDSQRWAEDIGNHILKYAGETGARMQEEAAKILDPERQREMYGWATSSRNVNRMSAMATAARSDPSTWIKIDDLNHNPWLLNVRNGTLNLETGSLERPDQDDLNTRMAGCEYRRGTPRPQFNLFLEQILPDPEIRAYVQRALGYSLTGLQTEQCFFVPQGEGANGKSTLLRAVKLVMGEYAGHADVDSFTVRNYSSGQIRQDLARLAGLRLVTTSELEIGARLNDRLVKDITGGDMITSRFLYGQEFEYAAQFKLWMPTNHLPRAEATDNAIWRRVRTVPFPIVFSEAEMDRHLDEKLAAELPGILEWLVDGCTEWQVNGMQVPTEVRRATEAHRAENDNIARFVDEECETTEEEKDTSYRTKPSALHIAYVKWCEQHHEKAADLTTLRKRLETLGFDQVATKGTKVWRRIRPDQPDSGYQDEPVGPKMDAGDIFPANPGV